MKKSDTKVANSFIDFDFKSLPHRVGEKYFSVDDLQITLAKNEMVLTWPSAFDSANQVLIYSDLKRENKLLTKNLSPKEIKSTGKVSRYTIVISQKMPDSLPEENYSFCLIKKSDDTPFEVCSNFFFAQKTDLKKNNVNTSPYSIKFNGQKMPKRSYVELIKDSKDFNLTVLSKKGFSLVLNYKIQYYSHKNLYVDLSNKRIGIKSEDSSGKSKVTLLSYLTEKNYMQDKFHFKKKWIGKSDEETFSISVPDGLFNIQKLAFNPPFPSDFKGLKTIEEGALGTYSPNRLISLHNKHNLDTDKAVTVAIPNHPTNISWTFMAPKKGEFNTDSLKVKTPHNSYYLKTQIYRAYSGSISASSLLSASPTLDLVLGYNFSAEYWFEKIAGESPYLFQRFGLNFNLYETLQGFKPTKNFFEKVRIRPMNLDLLYRFKSGVRPLTSSFGLGLRYLDYHYQRTISGPLNPKFIGIGVFWHTSPQKVVDTIFNTIPIFRYPKWMELGLYYYPILIGDFSNGVSWSYHARGKLYFSKKWFFVASINVADIRFKAPTASETRLATTWGTLGFGVNL